MSKTVKAEAKRGGVTLFLLGYFVYCMVYVCRNSISIVQSEMGFGDGEFSFLVAALLACYAVGRLLNGYLGDKIPRNIMIGTGITVAGACHVAMGLLYPLHLFPLLVVLWALNGYAQSMIWGPLLDGVYRRMGGKKSLPPFWFPPLARAAF